MKTALSFIKTGTILLFACILILLTNDARFAIQEGLRLCAGSVLPVLFPFFVLSDFWIRCGAASQTAAFFEPVMKAVFHLPGSAASAFLLGCIGGYPVGARTASQLYRDSALSKEAAEQTLLFCNNAGPSFIIGVVGYGVFHSAAAGVLLYGIHLFCAIGIGILFRPKETESAYISIQEKPEPFITACINSVSQGGKTAITVCVFILFFSVLTSCIAGLLPSSPVTSLALPGILEITSGFQALSATSLHPRTAYTISAFMLGLGGCCVFMQAVSFAEATGLSCKKMLIGKGLQSVSSAAAAYVLWPYLPSANPCCRINSGTEPTSQLLLILLFCIPFLLFLKKSSGKTGESLI